MYTTKIGFTEKSAPLNATFILEEARRESWDENNPFIIVHSIYHLDVPLARY
jgi:hypothetical protein